MRVLLFMFTLAAAARLIAGDPEAKDLGSGKPVGLAAPDGESAPDGWCHIRGRVVYDGDAAPKRVAIAGAGGVLTEDWVVEGKHRGVQNVIVWLAQEPTKEQWERLKSSGSNRLREFPSFPAEAIHPTLPARTDVTIVLPDTPSAFAPHVAAVRAGSSVVFQNLGRGAETVKWESLNNGAGNRALNALNGQVTLNKVASERFPMSFGSAISPWLRAYVRVFDHPYFAVTGADGRFDIRCAPKGDLRLFVWQEAAGFRNRAEGRFGEPVKAPSGRLDLGDLKIKER
jgi:hypothetical protein